MIDIQNDIQNDIHELQASTNEWSDGISTYDDTLGVRVRVDTWRVLSPDRHRN